MATINNRIAALEAEHKNRLSRPSPELETDMRTASKWFHANGCRPDVLPRDDMTEGERAALVTIIEVHGMI
jgi:hypothetical protein